MSKLERCETLMSRLIAHLDSQYHFNAPPSAPDRDEYEELLRLLGKLGEKYSTEQEHLHIIALRLTHGAMWHGDSGGDIWASWDNTRDNIVRANAVAQMKAEIEPYMSQYIYIGKRAHQHRENGHTKSEFRCIGYQEGIAFSIRQMVAEEYGQGFHREIENLIMKVDSMIEQFGREK